MATTTNNGWVTPDNTAYVKDGASAIRSLGQSIDTSVGTGLLAWQTWAPTLSSGWANGNGVWVARYCQIGKTVHVQATFTVGSTTTKGTTCIMSLPVTAQSASNVPLGVGYSFISGTASTLQVYVNNATTVQLTAVLASGTYAGLTGYTSSIPGPWATGSTFTFGMTYEAA